MSAEVERAKVVAWLRDRARQCHAVADKHKMPEASALRLQADAFATAADAIASGAHEVQP